MPPKSTHSFLNNLRLRKRKGDAFCHRRVNLISQAIEMSLQEQIFSPKLFKIANDIAISGQADKYIYIVIFSNENWQR